MTAIDAMVDRTIGGRGGVVKSWDRRASERSRAAREAAAAAAGGGVEVFWAFCESHAGDIPFRVVAQLLRAGTGVADLDREAARIRVRTRVPDADPQDLLLFDDLLGIADPEVPLPQIDPDARRRRLTAMVNAASLARTEPALYVIEDVHWIDAVSESMLADFLAVIPRTPSMVLITSRPEYRGSADAGARRPDDALAPLADSDTAALIGELLGSDPSVAELAAIIAERAAGNPFFAEEMVRELVQRSVLAGERGSYVCGTNAAEVTVPATVQAAIAARIDRLNTPARRTLHAASVIGARFGAELLAALGIDAVFDELLGAELIDQVRFTPSAEYAFHHPLIRAVAYESQLKSDRAQWHRRLATAIQEREPGSVEENAALIAEHLQAAGELHAAYGWHMRAAAWSANRDSAPPGSVGSAHARSPTHCRRRPRPIVDAHRPAHHAVCHRLASPTIQESPWPLRGAAGVVQRGRGQGLAGHRHGRAGHRAPLRRARARGVAAGIRTDGAAGVDRRSQLDHRVGVRSVRQLVRCRRIRRDLAVVADHYRPGRGDPAKGAGFGLGSPLAIAVAFPGLLGGGWAVPGGAKTSTTPSRWPETATRQPSALSSPGPTVAIVQRASGR